MGKNIYILSIKHTKIIKIFINFFIFFFIKKIIKHRINSISIFPKVSVFLPIYNKESFLKRSIKSIQRQTLKNLEIIAINDFSTDNSLKVLKCMAKNDKRIKIINNDRNHGLLYSRGMGILNCTGEYIMNLDPDDKLSNKKNLEILYEKAKKFKIDIIIFRLKKLYTNNETIYNDIKDLKLRFLFTENNTLQKWKVHNLITNKFIKRKIALKAYHYLEKKIHKNKWNYGEDNIWSILIKKFSNSIIYFNKFIYIYFKNKYSLMHNNGNDLQIKNKIYRFEMLISLYNIKNINALNKLLNNTKDTIKRDIEIRNLIIRLFIHFIKYYRRNKLVIKKLTKVLKKYIKY